MKSICIVDTCSLIYLAKVETTIGNKRPFNWLWDEFEIRYSKVVLKEINNHRGHIHKSRNFDKYVWKQGINYLENRLFGRELTRIVARPRKCKQCNQPITWLQKFTPDLNNNIDRGERHNCCVAVDMIIRSKYQQVIFLSDDLKAVTDYASSIFNIFPIGTIWSSLDFILYLYTKYNNRITVDEAKECLRNVNAQNIDEASKLAGRLTTYTNRLLLIDELLS